MSRPCFGRLVGGGRQVEGCERKAAWRVFDPSDGEELVVTCDEHLPLYIRGAGWTEVGVEVLEDEDDG